MPTFNVMINWTHTVERSVEIEIKAKDEEAAREKAKAQIDKVLEADGSEKLVEEFGFEDTNWDNSFEYDASEA